MIKILKYLFLINNIMAHNLILNYFKFLKINNEFTIEELMNRQINYKNTKSYYNSIHYPQSSSLKALNFVVDPINNRKKYTIIKQLTPLSMYIPWKYGLQLEPAEIKRIQYFIQVALNRGYNKFVLQMIFVADEIKYAISLKNIEMLKIYIKEEVSGFLKSSFLDKMVLFKTEVITKSELSDVTTAYGGFFLIATTVIDDRFNL